MRFMTKHLIILILSPSLHTKVNIDELRNCNSGSDGVTGSLSDVVLLGGGGDVAVIAVGGGGMPPSSSLASVGENSQQVGVE